MLAKPCDKGMSYTLPSRDILSVADCRSSSPADNCQKNKTPPERGLSWSRGGLLLAPPQGCQASQAEAEQGEAARLRNRRVGGGECHFADTAQ